MPTAPILATNRHFALAAVALVAEVSLITGIAAMTGCSAAPTFPVVFSGGHETAPRDAGRPVVLIAAALGVKPEIFRDAFKGVRPARDGRPSPEEARSNKVVLMNVLKPHGVTNERPDEVSDYYRYRPQRGELWTTAPAKAYAIVENGKIREIVVTEPGSGYSTSPKATVKGMERIGLKVKIVFDKDLKKNGAVGSIEVVRTE
jgi:hypothetical protein